MVSHSDLDILNVIQFNHIFPKWCSKRGIKHHLKNGTCRHKRKQVVTLQDNLFLDYSYRVSVSNQSDKLEVVFNALLFW